MLGVDVSNYSGAVGVNKFQELKAQGVSFVIPGCQIDAQGHSYTADQIKDAEAAGLAVPATYELLYWDNDDLNRMTHAMSFGLPVWLDCEVTTRLSQGDTIGRIWAAVNFLGASCAGIYTGRWWWEPSTGNTTAFANQSLWHAEYRPDPFKDFKSYGGWATPTIWQYSNQGLAGVNCDLNLMADPVTPVLSDQDHIYACVSAAQFVRLGWNLQDLHPNDKQALKELAERANS